MRIAEGGFVVLCHSAANPDEEAFGPDSELFDIRREGGPPHLDFGVGPAGRILDRPTP